MAACSEVVPHWRVAAYYIGNAAIASIPIAIFIVMAAAIVVTAAMKIAASDLCMVGGWVDGQQTTSTVACRHRQSLATSLHEQLVICSLLRNFCWRSI